MSSIQTSRTFNTLSALMAKQHCMALLTIACLVTAIEIILWQSDYCLLLALFIIAVGSIITCIRHAISAYQFLES